ncbi:SOS response-associated peptidase [Aureimonas sp. ME7]|uniref:SOS response-associated peptidase n=1 Tax=Aureimonas sp. ME7 TaxID=2744252 RepID=UPI001FCE9AD0|nr:SOS response-associated peptidase [Aureimonas sp. ME7]
MRYIPLMCGRFSLTATPEAVAETFSLGALDPFPPRYNIAPTQPVLYVAPVKRRGAVRREGALARWGFIPAWASDPAHLPLMFNARAENAGARNSFRAALRYRRCLVPASGFYEWRRREGEKGQPFFIRPVDGGVVAFAGIFETFLAPDGSEIDTLAILTAPAEPLLRPIHERAPVVIGEEDFERWLDVENHAPDDVADLLHARWTDGFAAVRVSDLVNTVANMRPQVQEPLEPSSPRGDGPSPSQPRLL